ncbi:MAG: copper homeostasis protein CutC [Woeseiaceae bacterium]
MLAGQHAEPILEVCVDGPVGAAIAAQSGADRIELCSALSLGGITPSLGAVRLALRQDIPVHVLIRPRSGGFHYNDAESETMLEDISDIVAAGASGLVLGALDSKNDLDLPLLDRLLRTSGDIPVTLHRAFDFARNSSDALEQAIELGFSRILTSGEQPDVIRGLENLQSLFERAGDRISIMPGGGVTPENLPRLLAALPLTEIHASCKRRAHSGTNSEFALGPTDDGGYFETCAETVRAMRDLLGRQ